MATLREITEDIRALGELLTEIDGDISDEEIERTIDQWLAETEESLSEKLDRYAGLIKSMESSARERKAEADRLTALAATDENGARRLKNRLLYYLTEQGQRKVETKYHKISVAKNGGKQALDVHGPVPDEYMEVIRVVDNEKIRRHLEQGVELSFARLADRGEHVRIR